MIAQFIALTITPMEKEMKQLITLAGTANKHKMRDEWEDIVT